MSQRDSLPNRRVLIAAFSLPLTVTLHGPQETIVSPPSPPQLSASQELLATAVSSRLELMQDEPPYVEQIAPRPSFSQRDRVNMSELMAEATIIEPKFLPAPVS